MENEVVYAGQVLDEPVFSHKDGGKKYYRVRISCQRMNSRKNKFDIVPVVLRESLVREADVKPMAIIKVTGKFCSRLRDNGNNTFIRQNYILATEAIPWLVDVNEFEGVGIVETEPEIRTTVNGQQVCELIIKNKNTFSDYHLPIVFWGAKIKKAKKLMPGDVIEVTGMLQSRRSTRMYKGESVGCTLTECSVFTFRKLEGDIDAESTSF